jgi:quinol monooxygenase YgiN
LLCRAPTVFIILTRPAEDIILYRNIINAGAVAAITMTLVGCAASVVGNAPAGSPVTVVAHLDVARAGLDRAQGYLRDYVLASEHQPGALRMQLLQQVAASNHFTLVEVWASDDAYEAHIASPEVRAFHARLDPLLGSPHDERIFTSIGGNP